MNWSKSVKSLSAMIWTIEKSQTGLVKAKDCSIRKSISTQYIAKNYFCKSEFQFIFCIMFFCVRKFSIVDFLIYKIT